MDNYHVTKKGNKWAFTKEGNEKPTRTAETKEEVMQKSRDFMKDKTGSVKIHRQDGQIQEERTYQRKDDPRKTRG